MSPRSSTRAGARRPGRDLRRAGDRSRQAARARRTRWSASSPAASPAWPRRARSRSCAATGQFLDPHHLEVEVTDGDGRTRRAQKGRPVPEGDHRRRLQVGELPFVPTIRASSIRPARCELRAIPKRMLVIGGGIIGLEMATVYSTLGARIEVVEMLDGLMQGADRDLVKRLGEDEQAALRQHHAEDQDRRRRSEEGRHLGQVRRRAGARRAAALRHGADGRRPQPNGKKIGADKAGVAVERARLHPRRQADAHQRAAHLRDRRHRRPADAGAQGGARRPGGCRSGGRREVVFRRARDSVRRLHRSGSGVGGRDRGRSQGARA